MNSRYNTHVRLAVAATLALPMITLAGEAADGAVLDEVVVTAQKRIERVAADPSIQGYADGVFWERNSLSDQKAEKVTARVPEPMLTLFNE